jgi:hypothetical protein
MSHTQTALGMSTDLSAKCFIRHSSRWQLVPLSKLANIPPRRAFDELASSLATRDLSPRDAARDAPSLSSIRRVRRKRSIELCHLAGSVAAGLSADKSNSPIELLQRYRLTIKQATAAAMHRTAARRERAMLAARSGDFSCGVITGSPRPRSAFCHSANLADRPAKRINHLCRTQKLTASVFVGA